MFTNFKKVTLYKNLSINYKLVSNKRPRRTLKKNKVEIEMINSIKLIFLLLTLVNNQKLDEYHLPHQLFCMYPSL